MCVCVCVLAHVCASGVTDRTHVSFHHFSSHLSPLTCHLAFSHVAEQALCVPALILSGYLALSLPFIFLLTLSLPLSLPLFAPSPSPSLSPSLYLFSLSFSLSRSEEHTSELQSHLNL